MPETETLSERGHEIVNGLELAPRRRKAVLLQGPVGPFFAQLQDKLDSCGWDTVRILFNLGDERFHGEGRDVIFTGRMSQWPTSIANLLRNFEPDVILAFGDQRVIHRDAATAAKAAGVPMICFEEGYLRPDYVTMELHGNNAASPLRDWTPALPSPGEPPAPRRMPNNGFAVAARQAALYFTLLTLGALRYPYYRHHRERGIVRESLFWLRNAARKRLYSLMNLRLIHWIIEAYDKRYFVVALQVHDDLQLRSHGAGWTVETLIESTIASFARSAHGDHHLVFKGHPLDRGHGSSRELTAKLARLFGVEKRVHFVDDGSLGLLSRHSRGMVTINSTSAMIAFEQNKPVFAAGESFYGHLTANGEDRSLEALARFWRLTPQPDGRRWNDFRAWMVATSQVNGSYYIPDELPGTVERVVERLDQLLATAARERAAARGEHSPPSARTDKIKAEAMPVS